VLRPTPSTPPPGATTPSPAALAAEPTPSDDGGVDTKLSFGYDDDGPGIGLFVGLGLLLALVTGGVVQFHRRRAGG
jgi:hypothetical protein